MNLLWDKIHDPLEPLLAHSSHILCRNPIVNVVVIPKQVLDKEKIKLALISFINPCFWRLRQELFMMPYANIDATYSTQYSSNLLDVAQI